jgi:hypothetical protein
VSAQGIAKHRALAHQQLPGPVQHQTFVLIGRTASTAASPPHRSPPHHSHRSCRV